MSPTTQGILVLTVTLIMLVSGIPVAFGLGAIAIAFLVLFQGFDAIHVVAETFWFWPRRISRSSQFRCL